MGCGCGNKIRRPTGNIIKTAQGIVKTGLKKDTTNHKETENRKKVEKTRRDAILSALSRP